MRKAVVMAVAVMSGAFALPGLAQVGTGPGVTTSELAGLCAATEGAGAAANAAVGYCRGFIVSAGQYHAAVAARGRPAFCLPDPTPTLAAAEESFVAWARANPQFGRERAVDGLLRWAAETYPCAARRTARANR
ncbi:Rap1a/Tai family immunity protein [Roseomonas sp. CCTCC AB2023176]|uniref:Rap1a/Tai family immunity protein n=1 Tax=Roseomonas sp. CCTCC AB2023176 TaxID=3342640 RepID=UPI0035D5860E